ncbi:MAG: glycosyltransferase family 4 protein [Chloroflexota bacterium]
MKHPLKIGFVTGEYPPMEGGVGAYTQRLALALKEIGHEVHILTSRRAKPKIERQRSQSLGEAWQKINDINEPIEVNGLFIHGRFRRWNWTEMSTIADIAIRFEFDIVHIQYQAAAFNMQRVGINYLPWRLKWVLPTVVTFHDLRVPYLFPKAGPLRNWAVNALGRNADGAIVTNSEDQFALAERVSTDIETIPIGSNIPVKMTNHIEVEEIREKLGLQSDDVLLGYFGFIHPSKGADLLIKALFELSDRFHLLFIGGQTGSSDPHNTEPFYQELQQMIEGRELEDRVHWSGFISDERVSAMITASDLFVLPYRDGASLRRGSLMAALAHGKAIITTMPLQADSFFKHGSNVHLIDQANANALAQAIKNVSQDSEYRAQLAANAQSAASQFNWAGIASKTEALYQRIHPDG